MRKAEVSSIIRLVVILALLALLAGCGHSGSDSDGTSSGEGSGTGLTFEAAVVAGTVTLPSGATYLPSTLKVRTGRGLATVADDGSFTALGLAEGPVLMVAETAKGTPLLFGWTDGGALSARTTAEVLVFYAAGLFSLPTEAMLAARDALRNTTEIDSLASVIATQIANNPEAFASTNTAIATALQTLLVSFAAGQSSSPSTEMGSEETSGEQNGLTVSQTILTSLVSGQSTNELNYLINAVLINTTDEQSGLTTNIASGVNQIQISNRFIRPAYGYLEQTGYTAMDGTEVEETKTVKEFDITSVKAFSSTGGIGWDVLSGQQLAFEPVVTGPIELPMAAGAKMTHYTLTVIGPGTGVGETMTSEQSAKFQEIVLKYMVTQLVAPILSNAVAPYSPLSQANLTVLLTADNVVQDFISVMTSTLPDMVTAIQNHDMNAAMTAVMNAMATSNSFRQALVNVVLESLDEEMFWSAAGMADHVFAALTAVDALGTVTSSIFQFGDVYKAYPCNKWTLAATNPSVTLTPRESRVIRNNIRWFEANVPELSGSDGLPPGSVLHYIWTCSGSAGSLVNTDGTGSSNSFETTSNSVSYLANDAAGTDTITVEAILVQGVVRTSLGSVSSTIEVVAGRKCENRFMMVKWTYSNMYCVSARVYTIWTWQKGEDYYDLYKNGKWFDRTHRSATISKYALENGYISGDDVIAMTADMAEDELSILINFAGDVGGNPTEICTDQAANWDANYDRLLSGIGPYVGAALAQDVWVVPINSVNDPIIQ